MKVWQQDWIARWALYSPDKPAIQEHESDKAVTYRQLNEMGNAFAHYLTKDKNVSKGDRVVVLAEYSVEYIALFSAAQKAGFIVVPLNYRLSAPEIKEIIDNAAPVLIYYQESFKHLLPSDKDLNILTLPSVNSSDISGFDIIPVDEDDPIFIIYTSGTTGKPKGVKYTHKMAFWNSINTAISLKINTESRTVNVMPPFHTGGWNVLLLPFLHHGGFTYVCRKFDPQVVINTISSLKCTVFMAVPTMLAMMAQHSDFQHVDLSSLDYIIVGGEAMPVPLIKQYAGKQVAIRQGYGMTEVGPNLTSLHQDDAIRKIGSIGRPNFYVEHRIINEAGQDAAVDEPGELWLRGPMVMIEYWKNEQATKDTFSEDGNWFKTGDIVIEDNEKYIYIVDRLKNMFISGAENVYPAEIERVLQKLPYVKECVVVGVKDERWGEVGKAYVVTSGNTDEDTLRAHCQANLAKFKIPKYFVFMDELPKSDSGKIDRKLLKSL